MTSVKPQISNIVSKFGVLWIVLPYYGRIPEWKKLMLLLWNESRDTWLDYQKAFENLYEMTVFDWTEELACLLNKYGIAENPVLSPSYNLQLDLFKNSKSIWDFIKEAKDMKFKALNKLQINWLYKLGDKALTNANPFLSSWFPFLKVLHLQGWNRMDLRRIGCGLSSLLPKIHSQVYIHNFKIDEGTLKDVIFNWAFNCKELVMRYCFIGNLSEDLALPRSRHYKLEKISFFMTARADAKPE